MLGCQGSGAELAVLPVASERARAVVDRRWRDRKLISAMMHVERATALGIENPDRQDVPARPQSMTVDDEVDLSIAVEDAEAAPVHARVDACAVMTVGTVDVDRELGLHD